MARRRGMQGALRAVLALALLVLGAQASADSLVLISSGAVLGDGWVSQAIDIQSGILHVQLRGKFDGASPAVGIAVYGQDGELMTAGWGYGSGDRSDAHVVFNGTSLSTPERPRLIMGVPPSLEYPVYDQIGLHWTTGCADCAPFSRLSLVMFAAGGIVNWTYEVYASGGGVLGTMSGDSAFSHVSQAFDNADGHYARVAAPGTQVIVQDDLRLSVYASDRLTAFYMSTDAGGDESSMWVDTPNDRIDCPCGPEEFGAVSGPYEFHVDRISIHGPDGFTNGSEVIAFGADAPLLLAAAPSGVRPPVLM